VWLYSGKDAGRQSKAIIMKSVYLKNFGTFLFEVIKKPKMPAQLTKFDPTKTLKDNHVDRTNVNQVRYGSALT
jgi:hypothetical protein